MLIIVDSDKNVYRELPKIIRREIVMPWPFRMKRCSFRGRFGKGFYKLVYDTVRRDYILITKLEL